MATKRPNETEEPDEIGKAHPTVVADESSIAESGETESSGQRVGMGRGEKPQKPKHHSRR